MIYISNKKFSEKFYILTKNLFHEEILTPTKPKKIDIFEYIGRPSILGNEFTHLEINTLVKTRCHSRENAISNYEKNFWKDENKIKKLEKIKKKCIKKVRIFV